MLVTLVLLIVYVFRSLGLTILHFHLSPSAPFILVYRLHYHPSPSLRLLLLALCISFLSQTFYILIPLPLTDTSSHGPPTRDS